MTSRPQRTPDVSKTFQLTWVFFSSSLNDLIAKMADVKGETEEGARKISQIIDRDVAKLRNDVERQLQQCRKNCPSDCESCGAAKIDELLQKLQDFNATLVWIWTKEMSRADFDFDFRRILMKMMPRNPSDLNWCNSCNYFNWSQYLSLWYSLKL